MRRSGINQQVKFSERLVLPRISDLMHDVLDSIDACGPDGWETMILDFADAFKQLPVSKDQCRHPGGKALNGFFTYRVVCFGIKSGPPLWGRVAVLIMRLTAAIQGTEFVRIQTFVDDLAVTVAGTPVQRDRALLRTVIFWLVVGTRLSWSKGSRGRDVEWIGARLTPWLSPTKKPGVTIGITEDRVAKLAEQCSALTTYGECTP